MGDIQYEPGSFRDRNNKVFYKEQAVLRGLSESAFGEWKKLEGTRFFRRFMTEGKVVNTVYRGEERGEWSAILEHQKIPFISYPYEWSFGMLKDAALLQLELLLAALEEAVTLKDASAFNVQWIGSKPIFIDITSFEEWRAGEPWAGYRQFCQMFLYPLMLQAYKDIPFHPWLRGNIDGIPPEICARLMSTRDFFRPGVFTHVYLQNKLQRTYARTHRNVKNDLRAVGFHKDLIKANAERLAKTIRGLTWKRASSEWSDYEKQHSYEEADRKRKMDFVSRAVQSHAWNLVWDLGCNTGTFSKIAAENAKYVVAIDSDHLAVERFYQTLKQEENQNILPLVLNLTDPSPKLGWRGEERKSLEERGRPNLTLCLALLHHIVIGANIPLKEFIDWLSTLQTSLVIEFVTKEDSMVKFLLQNKKDDYHDYDVKYFEQCLLQSFRLMKREMLGSNTRILYFFEPF